jgi:hypothetical protein
MTTSGTTTQRRLSPYEQARLDKIKRNETRLASLGLLPVKKQQLTTTPRRRQETRGGFRRAANNSVVTPSPPSRTSGRLKSQPVQYAPLVDDDGRLKKKQESNMESSITPKTKRGFKCDIPMNVSSLPLTKDEKSKIENKMKGDDEFLAAFEDYLTNVDIISDPNRRSVLRQITKLVLGQGITYSRWPMGCIFLRDIKVGPTDDVLKLMSIGRECEEKWGKDLGNGWLLSHPLKKLYMFQQYLLQEE